MKKRSVDCQRHPSAKQFRNIEAEVRKSYQQRRLCLGSARVSRKRRFGKCENTLELKEAPVRRFLYTPPAVLFNSISSGKFTMFRLARTFMLRGCHTFAFQTLAAKLAQSFLACDNGA